MLTPLVPFFLVALNNKEHQWNNLFTVCLQSVSIQVHCDPRSSKKEEIERPYTLSSLLELESLHQPHLIDLFHLILMVDDLGGFHLKLKYSPFYSHFS